MDVARALALVGMMATHVLPAVSADGGVHPAYLLASGRASALFAVLAGVGLALATGGPQPLRGRRLLGARLGVTARAILLVLLGLSLGAVDSPPAVILAHYGVLFVLALPFLGLRAPALAAMAGTWAVAGPVLSHLIRRRVEDPTWSDLGWGVDVGDLVTELTLTGYYPALPWLTYLLAGLAVGRLRLSSDAVAARLVGGGVALAGAAWVVSDLLLDVFGGRAELLASVPADSPAASQGLDVALQTSLYGWTPTTSWWWLAVAGPHSGTPLDLAHTVGTALAVLGAGLLLARVAGRALWPVAALGSATLTAYTVHVLALRGDDGGGDRGTLLVVHVVVALLLATAWRTWVGRAPLEAVAAAADRTARRAIGPRPPAGTSPLHD